LARFVTRGTVILQSTECIMFSAQAKISEKSSSPLRRCLTMSTICCTLELASARSQSTFCKFLLNGKVSENNDVSTHTETINSLHVTACNSCEAVEDVSVFLSTVRLCRHVTMDLYVSVYKRRKASCFSAHRVRHNDVALGSCSTIMPFSLSFNRRTENETAELTVPMQLHTNWTEHE